MRNPCNGLARGDKQADSACASEVGQRLRHDVLATASLIQGFQTLLGDSIESLDLLCNELADTLVGDDRGSRESRIDRSQTTEQLSRIGQDCREALVRIEQCLSRLEGLATQSTSMATDGE